MKFFGITDAISSPEIISITDNNRNSSILLAISTIMLYDRSEGEFTAFLAKFMNDFADNGMIDDLSVRNEIKEGQKHVHPKDVIERMKDYYSKQNVAINCDDFSGYVDFNGDGVIDNNDEETDDSDYPSNPVYEEDLVNSEGLLRQVLGSVYTSLRQFVIGQLQIETARLGKGSSSVNPSSAADRTLYDTWTNAYSTINKANSLLLAMKRKGWNSVLPYYYAETLALRSFVYYQLAVLWGNVPVMIGGEGPTDYVPQRSQSDVLDLALADLLVARDMFGQNNPWGDYYMHFNQSNVSVLLAEVLLTLKQSSQAQQFLQMADAYSCELCIDGYPIYEAEVIEMIANEANGNTEEVVSYWSNRYNHYGTWNALKRLGIATEVASCSENELLFPIPVNELLANPYLTQNPGY